MNRALFLDRDGVINEDTGYVYMPEDFKFIEGIFELCRTAKKAGFLLIIVTNQAGIAHGYYSEEDLCVLNEWMLAEFRKNGVEITALYYCPFHPEYGIGEYKKDSLDRKPNPGMLIKARDAFDIDLSASVLIGDKDSDMKAGRAAGIGRLILLRGRYDYTPAEDVEVFETLTAIETRLFL